MFTVLHPTYTLRVEIKDRMNGGLTDNTGMAQSVLAGGERPPLHKWFNGLTGKTGCDEVLALVKDALAKAGVTECSVSLDRFEHKT